MAVTTSSGDGFALYNGDKLLNINTVWTDKETYPHACMFQYDAGIVDPSFTGEKVFQCYLSTMAASNNDGETVWHGPGYKIECVLTLSDKVASAIDIPAGQWIVSAPSEIGSGGSSAFALSAFWANHDILNTDGTVYLAASDPIPLDGMTVIEWDGDTTGLDVGTYISEGADSGYSLYKVAEYVPMRNGDVFAVWFVERAGAEIIGADDYYEAEFGQGGRCHSYLIASAPAGVYTPTVGTLTATITLPSDGLYLYSSDDGQARTTLYAYPASGEGDTTYDEKEFLSGLVMGLCGKGNPTFSGEKCLYNGVELPKLPKCEYEYAVLSDGEYSGSVGEVVKGIYKCVFFKAEPTVEVSAVGYLINIGLDQSNVKVYRFDGTDWVTSRDVFAFPVWSNHDLYNEDGSLHLAASNPVPVEDVFLKGYLAGAELRRKRVREPVAYLYNGVRLPKLPIAVGYPYAAIKREIIPPGYKLSVFKTVEHYTTTNGWLVGDKDSEYEELSGYYFAATDSAEWEYYDTKTRGVFADDVKWANFDVLNEDGSIRLPASEPVPVYE